MSSDSLQDVEMDLNVTDANGNPVNGLFFISAPTLSGALTAVDGTGVLPAGSSGSVSYTFIPTDQTAPTSPTVYYIGGTLKYVDPDMGGEVVSPIYSTAITVDPQADLQINYFLQKDVIGDDPSTPQVEPSEPAVLGMLVTNVGGGTATNLTITSAQPQIIQNEKGLADNFQIIGTQVGTQQETPSLTAALGDVAPGQTADADFLLLSSLQGEFQDFSATFNHTNALGGSETSLISSAQTHQLIHAGDFNYPDSTGEMDYLVNDIPNPESLPDTIYFSDGTTAPVNVATNATSSPVGSSAQLTFQVTANVTSGWDYIQLPYPGAGYTLSKVVRSDGTVIPVSDQAWTTDRTIAPTGKATVDYELHILDDNSTGSYMVYYKPTTTSPPAVTSLSTVSSPQSGPVGSIDVTFSEPINSSTFTTRNLRFFRFSAVYFRVAGANNFIVRDARVLLASPWSRWRPTMRPYSMDLRERVAAAIDAGEGSQRQVAKRFRVSVSFVTRLVQRRRDAGTLAPKPHGGGPRPALGFPERVRLAVRIAEHPDATLKQLKEWGGFACTLTTLWRTLRRFRLTYKKKTLHAGERDTPEVQAKRRRYRAKVRRIEAKRLVFVDETGVNTAMTPTPPGHGGVSGPRARCPPRGVRRP